MEFINTTITGNGASGDILELSETNRRRIRIQAMKDYRRKEAQRKSTPHRKLGGMMPNSNSLMPQVPSQIHDANLWRHSFAQKLVEGMFPQDYRPVALQISTHIYEGLGSEPIVTMQDALTILHVSAVSNDKHLLDEARQRYVLAIKTLRLAVSTETSKMPAARALLLAMITVQCESLRERRPFPKHLAIRAKPTGSPKLDCLLNLVSRVPPVLEAVDAIVEERPRQVDSCLLKSLIAQEKDLTTYLTILQTSGDDFLLENTINIEAMRTSTSKPLFDLAGESLCRICLLLIAEARYALEIMLSPSDPPTPTHHAQAVSLRKMMALLAAAAYTPLCKARVMSVPLHFLCRYYEEEGDFVGLRWCEQVCEDICRDAPWLRWNAMFPWFLPFQREVRFQAGRG